jgi:hypothetical protein
VAALVGDLVNADPAQVGEEVVTGRRVVLDPGDNRPHGPPRDPHELGDRGMEVCVVSRATWASK